MFELYATGRYGYYDLQEIMAERGLRTRPTTRFPKPQPISIHSIGRILRDHYYCGWVTHEGIEHPGRHPAIVSEELFQRVQHVLDAERGAGTRNRVHKHPLKGCLWCGRCGKRLLLAKANGNGGTYYYFFCIGRQHKNCTLPYLPVAEKIGVDAAVLQHYTTVRLDADFCAEVHTLTEAALSDELHTNEHLRRELTKRLAHLDTKETALVSYIGDPGWPQAKLNAQMQDLRREQEGIKQQLAELQSALNAGHQVLLYGMELLTEPDRIYDEGSDVVRAVLTKGIFTQLYLDADEERQVTVAAHELAEPFDALVPAQAAWRHAVGRKEATAGTEGYSTPAATPNSIRGRYSLVGAPASDDRVVNLLASIFYDRGSSKATLVEVLKAYSHTPERLDDLRKAVEIARRQEPDTPDDGRNEAASRPSRRTLADRLSPEDVQTIIDLRKDGTPTKDLAAKFGISTRSVRRLLRKHGARLSDRDQLNSPASPPTYKHHDLGPTK